MKLSRIKDKLVDNNLLFFGIHELEGETEQDRYSVILEVISLTFVGLQGLSVPFACIGSGDPVRVLHLYTTNTLDVLLKHLLLRHMYNLPLPILLCYAQALRSETSYCYRDRVTPSACVQVTLCECRVRIPIPHTVLCGALYTTCVDASRMVFWDRSVLR